MNLLYYYKSWMGMISNTVLWGFLPLDIVLHFFFGLIVVVVLGKFTKLPFKAVYLIILGIAVLKELMAKYQGTKAAQEGKEILEQLTATDK